jgi:hypothetical protein
VWFTLIGGRDLVLPEGWTSDSSFTFFGGAKIDATARSAEGATIRVFSVIGGIKVRVAKGARAKVVGGSLVGGRRVDVATGDGPEITVTACTLIGGVRITHAG